jgi:hypothetical protein
MVQKRKELLAYKVVPLTEAVSAGVDDRPNGWVASPYMPSQTMTSWLAMVSLCAFAPLLSKNMSMATLQLRLPATSESVSTAATGSSPIA